MTSPVLALPEQIFSYILVETSDEWQAALCVPSMVGGVPPETILRQF